MANKFKIALGWDRLVYGYARYGESAVTRGAVLSKIANEMYSFRLIPGSGKIGTVSQHAMSFNWRILEEKIK